MRKQRQDEKRLHRYSIRKFKFGAASITVGTLLFLGMGISTKAAEVDASVPTEQTSSQEATEEKLAEEKAAAEKLAEEKAAAEKLAEEKAAAEKLAEEKAAAEKLAEEKAAAEKLAEEKAAAEKLAEEKAAAEKLAEEEASAEKLAEEKAAAEKLAEEEAAKEKLAEEEASAEKLAEEKAAAEKLAEEEAAKEKLAEEEAAAGKLAEEEAAEKLAEELEKEEKLVEEVANEDDTVATRSAEQPAEEETKVATRAAADDGKVNSGDVDKELQNKIEQKAIYSPGQWNQTQGYQGTVGLQKDGTKYQHKNGDSPVANAKVYLQWTNKDGVVSPVYYTTSGADGRFVIDLSKPFEDGAGNTHMFQIAGDDSVAIRTWVTLEDEERYEVVKGGDGKQNFHKRLQRTNESWDFTAGINRIVNSEVLVQEKKNLNDWLHKPEAEWTTSGTSDGIWADKGDYGKIKGNVWYELYEPSGSDARWLKKDSKDVYATGVKVAASYVNDEVTRLFDTWKKENPNATLDDFRNAQAQIVADYQAQHGVGSHIAETVVGTVDKDGNYYIPFRGLYGANAYEKGNNRVTEEEYGQLVKDADISNSDVVLWNGNTSFALNKKRHINSDYMYVTPLIDNTVVYANNYRYNMFTSADVSRDLRDAKMLASYNGSSHDFSLLVTNPMHDISVENSTEEVAKPGDVLVSETGGLFPNREYQIQWFKDGVPVGDPVTVTSDNEGRVGSVPLTVPEDLDKETIYTSGVFLQNEDTSSTTEALALDSIVAVPATDADKYEPETTPIEKDYGTPTTEEEVIGSVTVPGYPEDQEPPKITVDDPTTLPDGTKEGKFEVPVTVTYPDGTTDKVVVEVTVGKQPDADKYEPEATPIEKDYGTPTTEEEVIGSVTVPGYPEDQEPPKITVDDPTQLPDGKTPGSYEVDVTVTYPDGTKDHVKVPVTVAEKIIVPPTVDPVDDQTVVEGNPITPITVVANDDGEVTIEVSNLPSGVTFNPETNEISGTPEVTDWGKDEEEREFTVVITVTDDDGKTVTEEFVITVQRDTDKDGAPDVTDPDDDGDGYTDEEENEAGTDPKDPDEFPATPITPIDGVDAIDDQTVIEGNPIESVTVNPENPEATVSVEGLPGGVTFNPETNEISGTPEVTDWGKDEEEREFTVIVTVENPDGSTVTEEFVITVQRDTDKDGAPDVTDPDDDGDGYTDEEEKEAGTDPKDPDSHPETDTPADNETYEPVVDKVEKDHGTPTTEEDVTGAVTIPDYPTEGEQPVITVDDPTQLPDGKTPGSYEVDVTVTYPDGTEDHVKVPVVVGEEDNVTPPADNETYEPVVETVEKDHGTPTTEEDVTGAVTIPDYPTEGEQPVITVDDPTQLPDGKTPGSYEVDVTVTYPDGTEDHVKVPVVVGEEDNVTPPADNETYEPVVDKVEKDHGTPTTEEDVTGAVTIPDYPTEGEQPVITVDDPTQLPDGNTPGSFEVDVTVTYPDGTEDHVKVPVVVGEEDNITPPADNETYEPVVETVEKDHGTPTTEEDVTGAVTIPDYPTEGEQPVITVDDPTQLPDGKTPGSYEVDVTVTYPDGTEDHVKVPVVVGEEDNVTPPADNETYEPVVDKVEKDHGTPTTEEDVTGAVTIPDYPTEGEQPVITVDDPTQLPDGKTPGSYEVDVTVTYPDGTEDHVKVPVVVGEEDNVTPPADNETYEPVVDKVEKDHGTPITEEDVTGAVTIPDYPTEGEQPVITVDDPTQLPDGNTPGSYEVDVTVTYPDGTKDHVKVPVVVGEEDNVTPPADNETYEPVVDKVEKDHGTPTTEEDVTGAVTIPDYPTEGEQPVITVDDPTQLPDGKTPGSYEVDVTVTYPDGTEDHVKVIVTVTDKDDNVDVVTPNPPIVNPVTEGDKEVHGGGTPGNTIEVTFPDGTIVETGVDDNGEWTVKVPGGIVLKPGDVITAVEKDKDGNVSKATEVVVGALKSSTPVTGNTDNGSDSGSKSNTDSDSESKVLPNTGEAKNNSGFIAGTAALFAGMSALILGRRRKEEK